MQTKPRKMEGFLKHSQSCLKKKYLKIDKNSSNFSFK